jgi:hypothetical protein
VLQLSFAGWFQCRLATDPDPYDERRGVSGYVKAYVGEPDLDRVVRWQPPATFERAHGPRIGVGVTAVSVNGTPAAAHPLLGAAVDLLGRPVFEGRNGVVAEDGLEPVYPFDLQVHAGPVRLRRAVVPKDASYPFDDLLAGGVEFGEPAASEIRAATGYAKELRPIWQARLEALRLDAAAAPPDAQPGLAERIAFISSALASPPGVMRFFGALMRYEYQLGSAAAIEDPGGVLGAIDRQAPWRAAFWLGGWDADVLCGYAVGTLAIPIAGGPHLTFGPRIRRP